MENIVEVETPKPPALYYHYLNKASQGSLICDTGNFPKSFDNSTHYVTQAYSDRIINGDIDRGSEVIRLAGGSDQGWASSLPKLSSSELKEFAVVALNLISTPEHVQIIHYFDESSGNSRPMVRALNKR